MVGGRVEGNGKLLVRGAATIRRAQIEDITLADDFKLHEQLQHCRASAVVVPVGFPPTAIPRIVVDDVHTAFTKIVQRFRPAVRAIRKGRSPDAYIAASARFASDIEVHPYATIGEDVEVGARSIIHSGVQIMQGCRIGEDVEIFPNAVLYERTVVGSRTTIHANAVIGGYGFGYRTVDGRHERVAQLGNVILGSDVEIGAGTTIDRGTYDPTVVGDGTKIDNQVMIGHNCHLGRHNLICSQVGIAGSCTTGDYVVMAGQVGLSDHLNIGDRAVLGAKAGLMNDVPADRVYIGVPATPERDQWKMWGHVRQLPNVRRQLKQLQQQIEHLTSRMEPDADEETRSEAA